MDIQGDSGSVGITAESDNYALFDREELDHLANMKLNLTQKQIIERPKTH